MLVAYRGDSNSDGHHLLPTSFEMIVYRNISLENDF